MLIRTFLSVVLMMVSSFSAAQDFGQQEIQFDIDGDGQSERFSLGDFIDTNGYFWISLDIQGNNFDKVRVDRLDFPDHMAQETYFDILFTEPQNLLLLTTQKGSPDNRTSVQSLTLTYHDAAIRVTALSYLHFGSNDRSNWQRCDVNMLTGQGFRSRGMAPAVAYQIEPNTLEISQWHPNKIWIETDDDLPNICGS